MKSTDRLEARVASAFFGRFPDLRPAQKDAIEPVVDGSNVVISSGTGSGKTEAALAPLVSRYWLAAARDRELVVLYIAPTKALVNDLEKRLGSPLGSLGLEVGIRHGDRDDLSLGKLPQVLITTPESLEVLMFRKDRALGSVRAVVLDEVHLLYNTQRGLQLAVLIRRLQQRLSRSVQWIALSATIGRPEDVATFFGGSSEGVVAIQHPAVRTIDAQIRRAHSPADLVQLVKRLIEGRPAKLLLFANSRKECERLVGVLSADVELRAALFAHYSSLSPEVRVEVERKFSELRTAICVATSTLELGIDIGDIDAVILWAPPSNVESFLQRIGRSNRRSQKVNVVCVVPDESSSPLQDAAVFAALIQAARRGEVALRSPFELYGAAAQQCASMIASDGGRFTRAADLHMMFSGHGFLDRGKLEDILAGLIASGCLQRHGFKNQYGADEVLHTMVDLKMIYGNFPQGAQAIDLFHMSMRLGEVPISNLLKVRHGDVVRFAGKRWSIRRIVRDRIEVEPDSSRRPAIDFTYSGKRPGVEPNIANKVWRLLHTFEEIEMLFAAELRKLVAAKTSAIAGNYPQDAIPFHRASDGIHYYTFAGRIVNNAIALKLGKAGAIAKDMVLISQSSVDWASLPKDPEEYQDIFQQLFEPDADQSYFQKLLPADLQIREFLQPWLKDSATREILDRLANSTPLPVAPALLAEFE